MTYSSNSLRSVRRKLEGEAQKKALWREKIAFQPAANGLRMHLTNIPERVTGAVTVSKLTVDGVDRLGSLVTNPANLVSATTFPRTASNGGVLVNTTYESIKPGRWYLLSYVITSQTAGANPFFHGNAAFATAYNPLPKGLGRHSVLVQAKTTMPGSGQIDLIRATNGTITVSSVTLHEADWDIDLSYAQEWALTTNPGTITLNGGTAVAMTPGGTLTTGEYFWLTYEIVEAQGLTSLFVPDQYSPFDYYDLPITKGIHRVRLRVDTDLTERTSVMRMTGTATITGVSLRREGQGRSVNAEISVGGRTYTASTTAALPNVWHVSEKGSDISGVGSVEHPFRTPEHAMKFCTTGQTLYLRPGVYPAFDVTASGVSDLNRFRVTTLTGEERQALVVGHKLALAKSSGNYHAIRVRSRSYVEVSNLRVGWTKKEGIIFQGQEPELDVGAPPISRGHLIQGNLVRDTGSSAIMVCGFYPGRRIGIGNAATEVVRIESVLIRKNDVARTNNPNDYNATFTDANGNIGGGNNEAITVCCAYKDVITEYNDIHDTKQYGVDYKSGGTGGAIRYNRIWNCVNHGIYIETGRRFVRNLDVHDNIIWQCRNGIVLAREADYVTEPGPIEDFQMELRNIRIYNNLIFKMDRDGIAASPHHGDHYSGIITGIRILFNTIVDCGQEEGHHYRKEVRLSGWTGPDWVAAGVLSDFVVAGNLVWRRDGEPGVLDEFSGTAGVTIAENFNFTGAVDPLFTSKANREVVIGEGEYLREIILPDFSLAANSPAAAMVNGRNASPYNLIANGLARLNPSAAGAYGVSEEVVTAPLLAPSNLFTEAQADFSETVHINTRGNWTVAQGDMREINGNGFNYDVRLKFDTPMTVGVSHIALWSTVVGTTGSYKAQFGGDGSISGPSVAGNEIMPKAFYMSAADATEAFTRFGFNPSGDNLDARITGVKVFDLSSTDPNTVACDVVLCLGDSNMSNAVSDFASETNLTVPFDGRVWYMPCLRISPFAFSKTGSLRHVPQPAIEPIQAAGGALRMSPLQAFGAAFVGYSAARGRPLLLLSLGDAGSGLNGSEDWRKTSSVATTGARMYGEMMAMVAAMQALGPAHEIVGAIVSLGANDTTGADYNIVWVPQAQQFIANLRADLGNPNLPVCWSCVGDHYEPIEGEDRGARMIAAQESLDQDSGSGNAVTGVRTVRMPTGNALGAATDPHYTAAGMQANGQVMAAGLLELLA